MKKFLEVLLDDDGNMHFSTDFQFPDSVENPPVNMEEYEREHDQLTRKLMKGLVQEVWKKRSFHPSKAIRHLAMAEIIACAEPYEVAEEFWSTMMFNYIPLYEKFASKLKRPFGYDSSKMKRPVTRVFPGGIDAVWYRQNAQLTMAFQRIVTRKLPNGQSGKVYPFHLSLEGMESVTLCRDEEDYDHLEKSYYLACWKSNCLPIIGIAMSNHGHLALLAEELGAAKKTGTLIKKRHSQYLSWKYNESGVLGRADVNIQYLDSDWYVRNALAYIPRNALDTGCRIEDYKWSGYRGMFVEGACPAGVRKVADMSRRERETLLRTHEDLSQVPWIVNADGGVEPVSACDHLYLESAFNNDPAFFLKTLGTLNPTEMQQKLVENGRRRQTDMELLAILTNLADKWYHRAATDLTPEMKARLLPYLYRCYRTNIPQLARCLQMPRDLVRELCPRFRPVPSQGRGR